MVAVTLWSVSRSHVLLWLHHVQLKAHTEGAVNTLFVANRTTLVSGGKDGLVKVWNESFQCVHTVNLREQWMEFKRPSSVHALHYDVASTSVVVGTKAAEIVYFSTVDAAGSMLHAAHYRGEVWGLAANPVNPQYVTTGDDRMVRLWDTTARKCVAATKVPSYARCAAYSPDGCFLAVGMGGRLGGVIPKINGAFVVMDAETLDMTYRGQVCQHTPHRPSPVAVCTAHCSPVPRFSVCRSGTPGLSPRAF